MVSRELLNYVVFDFETGGLNPLFNEAIEIAGKAYNGRTLEPVPLEQGGEFCSLMKPLYPERLEPGALKVNNKTKDELMVAPDQKLVWNQFVNWVKKWNPKQNRWTAPIACGKNIRSFDMMFLNELNKKHCDKKEETIVFNTRRQLDLEDFLHLWFENSSDLVNEKMDTLREFFGLDMDGAHSALVDVRQTGELIFRFLRLHRQLRSKGVVTFKGVKNAA
jgi:DNA polymerase III alpha subunit (gram-positive type)